MTIRPLGDDQDAPQFDGWSGGPSRTKSWGHTGRHFKHSFWYWNVDLPFRRNPSMVLQQVDIPYWNPDLRFSWRRIEPLKVLTSVFCFPMALIPFGNQLHGWKIPKLWQIRFDDFPISGFSIANRLCPLLHGPQSRLVVAMQVRPRAFGYSW